VEGHFVISSPLDQTINRVAILIDRTPEILVFALNGDDRFIQMPVITQPALAFVQSSRIRWAKLQGLSPYGLVGNDDATFG